MGLSSGSVSLMDRFDAVIVGGGMAGVSAGFYISELGMSVALLDMEAQLAHHTTGRSAALYFENYGHLAIRPLSQASRPVFEHPIADLVDGPLFGDRRGAMTVAGPEHVADLERRQIEAVRAGTTVYLITSKEASQRVPAMREGTLAVALWEPDAVDIDVAAAHQMYARGIRRNGGTIRTSMRVTSLAADRDGWQVGVDGEQLAARAVVNATGAWGDQVAALAGLEPIGLEPRRRTAFMVPGHSDWSHWPLVDSAAHDFYFKPDGTQLLCSPSEEELTEPGDPRPRQEDIALAIDRINEMTTIGIRSVRSAWTGLRTFAPDRCMVIGEDAAAAAFFWLVGQGGTGIQTAPAAGRLLAGLVAHGAAPSDLSHVDLMALSPGRFAS